MSEKVPVHIQEQAKLPGKLSSVDGMIHQEDYGEWPVCPICKKQVEPSEYSLHSNSHINVAGTP